MFNYKNIFIAFVLFWQSTPLHCQGQDLKIYVIDNFGQLIIYADNPAIYPQTVEIDLELVGYVTRNEQPDYFVVPPKTNKHLLIELTTPYKGNAKFSYKTSTWIGDFDAKHDEDYIYQLPFEVGKYFNLSQGYDGKLTHQNRYELDFTMKEGTPIHAAREGLVIMVKEDSKVGCPTSLCQNLENYITIQHNDKSMADYLHIRKDGAMVEVGDSVKKGDLIGYSGNTGWTSGPHLHFMVKTSAKDGYVTHPTLFKTDKKNGTYLFEGHSYKH